MGSAYNQFRWSCIQKIVAGLAIGLAGVALALAEIPFGAVTIPQTPWFGAIIAVAGLLYSTSAAVALHSRRKPLVRR